MKPQNSILLLLLFAFILLPGFLVAQCCGVGGGNPMAGDASRGVIMQGQTEVALYYQGSRSDRFMSGTEKDTGFMKKFTSDYLYARLAYGLNERVTLGAEFGWWMDKTQHGLPNRNTYSSGGPGDLILYPRFNLIKPSVANKFNELTLGLGFKIPIGSYSDSIGLYEPFSGETFYSIMPPAVQASSGANDVLFNLFWSAPLRPEGIRLTSNVLYILKGWNPLGEKLGNYFSLGLFGSQTIANHLFGALQLRYEWIGRMQVNPDVLMMSFPNYDPEATGSRKLFIGPQLSYSPIDVLTLFVQAEFPLYQNVRKTQLASQHQWTIGLSYRQMKKATAVINPARSLP
ncbi:MAG TPA: hypothetical protein PKE03_05285 [Bacteroidales bacterium]|nr:hypothetical protein [Bacteroidales bacterium]